MTKKFLFDDETKPAESKLNYGDGFRFGLGVFIAWLLGVLAVSAVATLVTHFFRL